MWHAHSGIQRQDGAFGAFIVRENSQDDIHAKKYDFDQSEHIIIINDWLNITGIEKFVQHYHNDGNIRADAILINGKGVYYEYQTSLKGIIETPRAVFTVKKGFRYRFRLIDAGVLLCPMQISIDNHNITVIATDGNDVEAIELESLTIYAGKVKDSF
jgi:L-ascorbate oxidase